MDQKSFSRHISNRFSEELEDLLTRVIEMGRIVERQLKGALVALVEGDVDSGEKAIAADETINALELALDEECVVVLARHQPAARDLRFVMTVIRTITDLERIGDEAERVARMGVQLAAAQRPEALVEEIDELGKQVRLILRAALDALARKDAEHAVLTAKQDRLADRQYERILRGITEAMMQEPDSVPTMMDMLWAARSLERVGDRARNICEHVIYWAKGKDVRHVSLENMAEHVRGKRED